MRTVKYRRLAKPASRTRELSDGPALNFYDLAQIGNFQFQAMFCTNEIRKRLARAVLAMGGDQARL